ncbi:MAG: PTS sugar transporter subunit IIA [Chlamydiae bacterium]|nr:PTS sugar transporter subunit IIA [Chlamydiota bacterium]
MAILVKFEISHYLDEKLICFLHAKNQHDALSKLIDCLDDSNKLIDKDAFFQAILDREKIVSTGIGMGVAIPHAKLPGYKEFFIAIGIQENRGVEWDALDGLPIRIIFLIGGPETEQTQYLKILSSITTAIKDEQRRKKLLKVKTQKEVLEIFHGI